MATADGFVLNVSQVWQALSPAMFRLQDVQQNLNDQCSYEYIEGQDDYGMPCRYAALSAANALELVQGGPLCGQYFLQLPYSQIVFLQDGAQVVG